jgi:hypothetical protein
MKIKNLSDEQKKNFKANIPIYFEFLKNNKPLLSDSSHKLYSRALSFVAIENELINKTPKELALALTKDILTTSNFQKIIGQDAGSIQNIRLSAFRNLVEPFKDDLKNEISAVSYKALNKLVSRKGTHIRQKIVNEKNQNIKTPAEQENMRSWAEVEEVVKKLNVQYGVILKRFFKTNEIPCYVTLRNILVGNLYVNNYHHYKDVKVHTMLRNEYKTCHLWINTVEPPKDRKNYFWINLDTNEHFIIIQKNKTTGGIRRIPGVEGQSEVVNQNKFKRFYLNKKVVNIIMFIKQTFNERCDVPFLKNNTRDGSITDNKWQRIIYSIFKEITPGICATTLRKILYNEIPFHKYTTAMTNYILECQDHNKDTCDTYYKKVDTANSVENWVEDSAEHGVILLQ